MNRSTPPAALLILMSMMSILISILVSIQIALASDPPRKPEKPSRSSTTFNPFMLGFKAMQFNASLYSRFMKDGVLPAMKGAARIQQDVMSSWIDVLAGKQSVRGHLNRMTNKTISGLRYDTLVHTLGRDLFGSARFKGERVLADSDLFRLSYIPPAKGSRPQKAAVFHVGGFLPYGDRIFRFLPEANLFDPLLKQGIPIYAMELKKDCQRSQSFSRCSLESVIDAIDRFSDVAHRHHGRKLVLEGYCGLGVHALSYLAAKPEAADAKFSVAALMVTPVDGKACTAINEVMSSIPEPVHQANWALARAFGRYLGGEVVGAGLNLALGDWYSKTPAGRFTAGWKSGNWSSVRKVDQLTPEQRKSLAGAYWISPEAALRCPMPLDLTESASRLWRQGITSNHQLPFSYRGQPLSLRSIRDRTSIQLVGFYGGRDKVVPEATATPLKQTLGGRYTHVVYPEAGHIAFVLTPESWNPRSKKGFAPNPAELMIKLYDQAP